MSEPPEQPVVPRLPQRLLALARRFRWVLAGLLLAAVALPFLTCGEPTPHVAPKAASAPPVEAGAPTAPAPHKLSGERRLSGSVFDDRNQPLVDARVRVSSLDDADALPWQGTTDKQGHFAFADLVAHDLSVEVSCPGHDTVERTLRPDDAGELVFTLARQGELLVSLRDAPGNPVEGAVITVTGPGLWPAAELRANAAGEVLFENLALGDYQARARRADRAAPVSLKVRVVPGERAQVALTLAPGLALPVQIVDATTQAPIAGAELSLYDVTPSIAPRSAQTDETGQLRIEGLLPGDVRLELRHAGHAARSLDVKLPLASAPLRLEMQGEATLAGSVVDEHGQPIAGVALSVSTREGLPIALDRGRSDRAEGPGELGVTRGPVPKIPIATSSDPAVGTLATESDAQGAFRIAGLPPVPVMLSAARAGYALGQLEVRELRPHTELRDVRVVLREAGRMEGSVRDARDHPVVGVYVSARTESGTEHSAITDSAGHFALLDVIGDLTVSAEPQGYAAVSCKAHVAPRQTARCDLVVGTTLYDLSVRVLDEYGFGLEGAVVSLTAKNNARVFTQVTKADGGAVLRELPEPPYQLSAEARGFVTHAEEVGASERELRIKLARAGSLAGHVTDSLGRAVPFALVSTDEGDATTTSDESGGFVLRAVPPGAHRIMAAHKSVGEGVSVEVRARPGETLEGIRVVLPGRYFAREGAEPERPDKGPEPDAGSARRTKPVDFELEQRGSEIVFGVITPGGAAERSGLRAGDVLQSIDGEPVLSAAQGRGMLRDPPGHTALIQLRRDRAQARVRYKRPGL